MPGPSCFSPRKKMNKLPVQEGLSNRTRCPGHPRLVIRPADLTLCPPENQSRVTRPNAPNLKVGIRKNYLWLRKSLWQPVFGLSAYPVSNLRCHVLMSKTRGRERSVICCKCGRSSRRDKAIVIE